MSSELSFKLNDLKEVIRKWIYLEDGSIIDVMLAAYVANQFDADPTWVLFLGVPSSAKTELLRMLDGHPQAYFLSDLTPNTFISGKEGEGQSLLFKVTYKTLIIKEFGTLLTMRSEQQSEILAQLREIYDGKYRKAFGNRKSIDWEGRVGLLASATPVYDRHHGVNTALGERFLVYRIRKGNGDEIVRKAQEGINKEPQMREELQKATHRFVDQFSAEHIREAKILISDDHKAVLRKLASFCAQARCHVPRDHYTRMVDQLPTPEEPARLVKQLTQMAGALALIHGRESTSTEVLDIIKRLAMDMAVNAILS